MRKDSIIANIAKDLGLNVGQIFTRKLRIVSRVSEKYFYVNLDNGNLYVKDRIDRETLCGAEATCFLSFDAVVENPLNIFTINIEIQDINDNAPTFYSDTVSFDAIELTAPGTKFSLQNAEDPDLGVNSVQTYKLSDNKHFILSETIKPDGSKYLELVLEKPLDRESEHKHELLLTATDGGSPVRSGTALIRIIVIDANDNVPVFTQEVYKISVSENMPVNNTIVTVNATDKDEGIYAQINYSFSKTTGSVHHTGSFSIHPKSGEIKINKKLDFEFVRNYELSVQAKDGGGHVTHCKVLVEVIDENDNAPEISITSLFSPIPEDSKPGTVIALIEVDDLDSGENGYIDCRLQDQQLFNLVLSTDRYYRIITTGNLDRENTSSYNITILATDRGSPPLSSRKTIRLDLSDVNDNPPTFTKSTYIIYITENNLPGALIYSMQASDPDAGDNAKIAYSISTMNAGDLPVSSCFSINIETGALYAQKTFDYEKNKEFLIQITARDGGSPPLTGNATLLIHIVDQNDNAPEILFPSSGSYGQDAFEMVPFTAEPGSLITKVVAVDADSGHNAWLSYHFIHMSEPSHFTINDQTGEIRTSRIFQEKDMLRQKVVVMVRDNGVPALSATVTLSLIVADNFQQVVPKFSNPLTDEEPQTNLQLYLVIALALISLLFIITVMMVIISKCKEPKPLPNFGTLNTSLYPAGDPRLMSMYSDGTLPFPYSYNVCVAMDPSGSDFGLPTSNQNVPVDNLIDTDDSGLGNESLPTTAVSQEEMRKDSVIANIAKDLGLDAGQVSSRKLRIVSRVSEKYFYVNLDNGNLYVKDRIDRETLCGAEATCFVTFDAVVENPLNIFTIKVDIQDINDNAPAFYPDTFTFEAIELTAPGTRFALHTAEDPDLGINAVQTYKFSDNKHFTLSETIKPDGSEFLELVLEKPLDRESQNVHEFSLTATDGGSPVRSATALVRIIVIDANDNFPVFTQEVYKIIVSENIPVNTTILTVNATDKDDGIYAQINYSFTKTAGSVHHTGTFSIHPKNGEIRVNKKLDFELTRNHELSVQAKDGGGHITHCKVLVEVIDENDNAPEISITSLFSPILEDSQPGTVIALIEVDDLDSGENGYIDCKLQNQQAFNLVLSTDRYYRIITTGDLDRETTPSYNITIIATDRGSPPLSSRRTIRLDISDVNDNPPAFTKSSYVVYITENNLPGALIHRIQASDPDAGDNAKIGYSISTMNAEDLPVSSYFSINIETGALYAQKTFDYEQHKECLIRTTARDSGSPSLTGNTTLLVRIVDQNDNAPEILFPSSGISGQDAFEMVPFTAEPGSLITKVVAVDADSGHNAWLSYHFIHMSEPYHFTINDQTGEIRTSRIFQEKDMLRQKAVVMVRDNGVPALSATVTLSLIVADNFEQVAPKLSNPLTDEGPPSNLQLYLVIALALISLLFIVTVMLVIISKCKESKPLPNFGTLNTSLYHAGDPRVLSMYSDGTLPFPYSYNVCVAMDQSGSDFGLLTSNQIVPVDNLIDTDDSGLGNESLKEAIPTTLVTQIHYSIVEEMRKDSVIANIAKDLGLNVGQLSPRNLRIVSRVSEKYFYVNLDNGNLHVKDRIDRETLCGAESTCFLSFDAVIENPLSITRVKIDIQDINDNAPVFYPDTFTFEVIESTAPGTKFALHNAEDPDLGINSVQTYKLSDNKHFILSETIKPDGSKFLELVLEKPLDRESQNVHEFSIVAADGGSPVRSATALIRIIVIDVNDNFPVFTQEVYKISVSENMPVNTTIVTVNATDEDEGANAQITYSFSKTSGNVHHTGTFSIHPKNGEVKVNRNLDFELMRNYELLVQAKDGGGHVTHCKVLVEVIDENDNAPEISITSLFSPVLENSQPGTVIALIEVDDLDTGENGYIDCKLMDQTLFNLVLSSDSYYRIVTRSNLDRETTSTYNITIIATDRGSSPLSSRKTIRLDISDVNDNPPTFNKSSHVVYITENNLPGALIHRIQASDPDAGDNAKIVYSISTINAEDLPVSSYLSINIETGALYAQKSFDYEQHKEFVIRATARDSGSPSLTGNATLLIRIVDQNDNAPKILFPSSGSVGQDAFEMVPFTAEPGSLITKVVAVDADSGHNAWLSYHFIHVSEPSHFTINEQTGEIRTSRIFQEKDMLRQKVVVMVRDNGVPALSATVTLSLIVADNFQQVVPKLSNPLTDEEPQTNLQLYLVIALALISLLFIITVMLVIISKCKEPKPLPNFGTLNSSLYPAGDPRLLSMYSDGTLPFPYSYNVCVAMDPSGSDFGLLQSNQIVPVDNLIDTDDSGLGNESLREAILTSTVTQDRIDRETLCGAEATCFLTFDAVIENPLTITRVKIDIQDINDNAPVFFPDTFNFEAIELTAPGTRFALQNAEDPDLGVNSVQAYKLSDNKHFILSETIKPDGSKFLELVLEKPLDRESQNVHEFSIVAADGGSPVRSATALIRIIVIDVNDNFPVFTQEVYKISVSENIPVNTTIVTVNATDKDEGANAQISYSFSKTSGSVHHTGTFSIHPKSGEVKVNRNLDFELTRNYELSVQAKDGGGHITHCKVLVEVIDENDNAPEISITSLFSPVLEDSQPGTVIALIEVDDLDSGENKYIDCKLQEQTLFNLVLSSDSYYRIVTTSSLDRETTSTYNITIIATDRGSPPLSSRKTIRLDISDVNDNPPTFKKSSYVVYITENNLPGALIYKIQASDPDAGDNAKIVYSISTINADDLPVSSYLSINIETGALYAQKSFDYEQHKEFVIRATARDSGSPSLTGNITLLIRIVDQNDNAPKILFPSSGSVGQDAFEMVPFTAEPGSLITKVVAVDADSGHNAWLSYHFIHVSEPSHFTINDQTGEIRTSRIFLEKDMLRQKVVVMVRDNGVHALSATVTLSLIVADNFQQVVPKLSNPLTDEEPQTNLQLYLVIALALISLLFIITVMLVIISKCKEPKPLPNFGTLNTSLYPAGDPRVLSMYSDGTLPFPYSYNVCVAMDPSGSDFGLLQSNQIVPVDNLIDTDDSGLGNESLKEAILTSAVTQVNGCHVSLVYQCPFYYISKVKPCSTHGNHISLTHEQNVWVIPVE
ncbi:protocadherin Fat 4-like [Hyperolius riggenbachi]|uniref:protocadherin Fat 4-like n=1 Tax=Hyperolius riggenbachi TaxID=752182 RepID=UPI0035A38353